MKIQQILEARYAHPMKQTITGVLFYDDREKDEMFIHNPGVVVTYKFREPYDGGVEPVDIVEIYGKSDSIQELIDRANIKAGDECLFQNDFKGIALSGWNYETDPISPWMIDDEPSRVQSRSDLHEARYAGKYDWSEVYKAYRSLAADLAYSNDYSFIRDASARTASDFDDDTGKHRIFILLDAVVNRDNYDKESAEEEMRFLLEERGIPYDKITVVDWYHDPHADVYMQVFYYK